MTGPRSTERRRAPGAPFSQAGELHRLEIVIGLEAEDRAKERQPGLQGAADGGLSAESMALALEGDIGVRDAVRREGRDDRLGLAGRHDSVLEALQDEHGA